MPPCNFRRFFPISLAVLVGVALAPSAQAAPSEDGRGVIRVTARVLSAPVIPPAEPVEKAGATGDSTRPEADARAADSAEMASAVEVQTRGVLYRIRRAEQPSPEESIPLVMECVGN